MLDCPSWCSAGSRADLGNGCGSARRQNNVGTLPDQAHYNSANPESNCFVHINTTQHSVPASTNTPKTITTTKTLSILSTFTHARRPHIRAFASHSQQRYFQRAEERFAKCRRCPGASSVCFSSKTDVGPSQRQRNFRRCTFHAPSHETARGVSSGDDDLHGTIPSSRALICKASTLEKIRHCARPPPKNHRPA
jgi:hypothetical protein